MVLDVGCVVDDLIRDLDQREGIENDIDSSCREAGPNRTGLVQPHPDRVIRVGLVLLIHGQGYSPRSAWRSLDSRMSAWVSAGVRL